MIRLSVTRFSVGIFHVKNYQLYRGGCWFLVQRIFSPSIMTMTTTTTTQQSNVVALNEFILWPYRYVRELVPSSNVRASPQHKTLVDNVQSITIVVAAIPEGMSLLQLTQIDSSMLTRLNVFAREPLDERFLKSVDDSYGDSFYPITRLTAVIASATYTLPLENFYAVANRAITPESVSAGASVVDAYTGNGELVEYRYLQQRQFKPTLLWDPLLGSIYRFVMPQKCLRCIIMPENFIRTSVNRGYWDFDGLIIYAFARNCTLVGGTPGEDSQLITSLSNDDPRTLAIITNFLSKIGMHKIESTAINQIYSIDRFMTIVVGSLNNLAL